jgi:hypothetical protein
MFSWLDAGCNLPSCMLCQFTNSLFFADSSRHAIPSCERTPTPFGSNCKLLPVVKCTPICYTSSVVFDAVVLALTLAKLKSNMTSGIGYIIYRDGLFYFLSVSITNSVVLAIEALPSRYELLKPAVLPFSTIITVTMGARVFSNLKLFRQKQSRALQELPISCTSTNVQRSANGNSSHSTPFVQPYTRSKNIVLIPSRTKPHTTRPFGNATQTPAKGRTTRSLKLLGRPSPSRSPSDPGKIRFVYLNLLCLDNSANNVLRFIICNPCSVVA